MSRFTLSQSIPENFDLSRLSLFLYLNSHHQPPQLAVLQQELPQVRFVPGTPFFAQNPDPATLRLSFATADVAKIREGVARLAQAL